MAEILTALGHILIAAAIFLFGVAFGLIVTWIIKDIRRERRFRQNQPSSRRTLRKKYG